MNPEALLLCEKSEKINCLWRCWRQDQTNLELSQFKPVLKCSTTYTKSSVLLFLSACLSTPAGLWALLHWNLTIIPNPGETQTSSNHPSSQCYNTVTPSCKNQEFRAQTSKEVIYIFPLIFKTEEGTVFSFIPWEDSSPPKLLHTPHVYLYIFISFSFNSKSMYLLHRKHQRSLFSVWDRATYWE